MVSAKIRKKFDLLRILRQICTPFASYYIPINQHSLYNFMLHLSAVHN